MTNKDLRALVDRLLKSATSMKNEIKEIDIKIKNNDPNIDELKARRDNLKNILIKITNAIGTLRNKSQLIVCYKYFENMKIKEIALKLDLKRDSVDDQLIRIKLALGKILLDNEGNLI